MSAMKPIIGRLSTVALAGFMTLSVSHAVRSEAAIEDFAGKQISLFIGTTAGGGYDLYARTLARHIARHIHGHPSIIAKNMPGAGGLALANYLYNRAPSDGSELATVQNGLPFEKLFQTLSAEGKNALFDATKFGWIGSMMQTVFVTVTWHASGVKTLQDATVKEVVLGASATSSDSYVLAMLSNNLLGTKFKVVHGYAGAAEVDLAVENGEVQGEAGKDWTTLMSTRPQWISDKKINILLQMGLKAHPDLAGVPRAIELARTPEDRQIMEIVFAKFGMSRPFLVPPGMAPERLETLRRAFDATMNDPAFRAEAEKLGMAVDPVSGENVQLLVSRIMATPTDLARRAREALRPQ
jgi:tripartite-type tricarboxylate transporter receptor subunit TctC